MIVSLACVPFVVAMTILNGQLKFQIRWQL